MKPIDQTLLGADDGNCFAACVASLLELPLAEVPNFCKGLTNDAWYPQFIEWLQARGWNAMFLQSLGIIERDATAGYYIASGPTERGMLHATVWCAGKLAHDPHPSRAGIQSITDYCFLYPLNPAAPTKPRQEGGHGLA